MNVVCVCVYVCVVSHVASDPMWLVLPFNATIIKFYPPLAAQRPCRTSQILPFT